MPSDNNEMFFIETIEVPSLESAVRLSDLSFTYTQSIKSRKAFKKAIKEGLVYLNQKRAYTADFIRGGEIITIYGSNNIPKQPQIDLDIQVLYEDDYLALVNKPAGIEVSGNKKWTLEHALTNNLKLSSQKDALTYPEAIHRLDYPTSGVLLIGKTRSIVFMLNKLFENREIQKNYHAICIGKMDERGVVELEIDGKKSKSEFKVLEQVTSPRFTYLNLVELKPHTGRRHQLRKHMAAIGNPILGDLLYGKEGLMLKGKGLYLHASSLEFVHPITEKKLKIMADLPKKFRKIFP